MCANTCENEQFILTALRNKEPLPGRIPSFVQSIMSNLASRYFAEHDNDEVGLPEEIILMTDVADYTVFKCFGYDSHWCGGPTTNMVGDDALRDKVAELEKEVKKEHPEYTVDMHGRINASNNITHWYVGPAITNEETLKFFINHLTVKGPDPKNVEKWRKSRLQCFDKNWCQFVSGSVVMEPGLGAGLSLISRLMRKNNDLLNEWYDLLIEPTILSFKAAIGAGHKLFCTADDMAYKSGPMMSPQNYRKFVTPRAKILCDMVRAADGVIFMHTDGYLDDVMECFIDAGYHAIQPLEPTSGMTIKRVKEKWGNRIACIGNVDTTKTLPFGTEAEVRAEVHKCMRDGTKKGYLFAASGTLHNRVKYENVMAMLDEWKKINNGTVHL